MSNTKNIVTSSRAWIEVDLEALSHNAREISLSLPRGCELMAVVKTDAYGHGITKVARRLWREGVKTFAVATVNEGILLRKNGVKGNILVLGYTHFADAKILSKNNLEQLVVDGAHAKSLDETGYKLNVHVAIDTGMHRLGIERKNFDEIESVFKCKNLTVVGVASHLASSDSQLSEDIDFTNEQIKNFYETVGDIQEKGYEVGKLHVQASYGVCNYPELMCDYARVGIMLYGVMSDNSKTKPLPDLQPVLSLHSRVIQIRRIEAGESVSYGRIFTATKPMRIAVVSIGYADGVPRQISGNGGVCIVNGVKVPIIGRVCMDLLMIDISEVGFVEPGDVVTLIGKNGDEEIRCEDFAVASGTITNEVLCRLNSRLERVYWR